MGRGFSMVVPVCLALSLGCEVQATQLEVVVGSDMAPGTELDRIEIRVTSPGYAGDAGAREVFVREIPMDEGQLSLPFSFGVVPRDGDPSGGARIELRAFSGPGFPPAGAELLTTAARASFVEHQTLRLPMHLFKACVDFPCPAMEVCTVIAAIPQCVAEESLGTVDGGMGDAGVARDAGAPPSTVDFALPPTVFGGAQRDYGRALAVHPPSGDVVLAGGLRGPVDLGETRLGDRGLTAPYLYVARFDANGDPAWARDFQGTGDAEASDVAVHADSGDIVVTGYFQGEINFGDGLRASADNRDIFVTRLRDNGDLRWSRTFGGRNIDWAYGVAIDPASGDALVIGREDGDADFGVEPLPTFMPGRCFLIRLSPEGNVRWRTSTGSPGLCFRARAAVDPGPGDIVVGGTAINYPALGVRDDQAFVARLASDGTPRWTREYGDSGDDGTHGIAIDPLSGEVVAAGHFSYAVDFGGITLTTVELTDAFLVRLAPDGTTVSAHRFGGGNADRAVAVAVDPVWGDAVLAGYFNSTFAYGDHELPSAGPGSDGFLLRVSRSGDARWATQLSGDRNIYPGAVAVDPDGIGVWASGSFEGTTQMGGVEVTSAGSPPDVFLIHLH